MSPPKTRSASAEDSSAALIEDWRAYTENLRSQSRGERAHMVADRARMEEVMAEERDLWEQERQLLKAEIAELKARVAHLESRGSISASEAMISPGSLPSTQIIPQSGAAGMSAAGSIAGSLPSIAVPQESGRNADGSPFYAPAPRHPSRTFEVSENNELRVDSIITTRETPIRVTSKELTSSDFGLQSPPHEMATLAETAPESIDISHIQPELEGVPIKASAVAPSFAAKVLSPNSSLSPAKLSPNIKSTLRDATNVQRSSSQEKKPSTLEVMAAPETTRLTLYAGHTPNHSISTFPILEESGGATPTQNQHLHNPPKVDELEGQELIEDRDEDPELKGKLSLATKPLPTDTSFLAEVNAKLEQAKRSGDISPESASSSRSNSQSQAGMRNRDSLGLLLSFTSSTAESEETAPSPLENAGDDEDAKADEIAPLRLKPSLNFGRPMGSK